MVNGRKVYCPFCGALIAIVIKRCISPTNIWYPFFMWSIVGIDMVAVNKQSFRIAGAREEEQEALLASYLLF